MELGISQNELARLSGLNPGTLANIMVGRVTKAPSIDTLQKLAVGLRVAPDLLFRIARGALALPGPGADSVPFCVVASLGERPRNGRYPLLDEEWRVLEHAVRTGLCFDLDRHRAILDVEPADRQWLFHGLASLASSIEVNFRNSHSRRS